MQVNAGEVEHIFPVLSVERDADTSFLPAVNCRDVHEMPLPRKAWESRSHCFKGSWLCTCHATSHGAIQTRCHMPIMNLQGSFKHANNFRELYRTAPTPSNSENIPVVYSQSLTKSCHLSYREVELSETDLPCSSPSVPQSQRNASLSLM